MESKRCTKCGIVKPLTEFTKDRTRTDGRRSECRECHNARGRRNWRNWNRTSDPVADSDAMLAGSRRGKHIITVGAAKMLWCPFDPELGVPMYNAPCYFERAGFQETLAAGYWPDGAVFRYAPQYRGKPSRWVVRGTRLLEIGGNRVAVARLKTDDHVSIKVCDAAQAADD